MRCIPEEDISCDIIGKDDKGICDCGQDNLFDKVEEIFKARDFKQLGEFTIEMIENCVSPAQAVQPKKKRKPSEWNKFVSEKMKGCGKDKPCSERMKEIAVEWKKLKEAKELEQKGAGS